MTLEPESVSDNNSVGANFSCICKIKLDSSKIELINCSKCNKQYHAACFGFMRQSQSVNFSCVECGTTDDQLKRIGKKNQIMMAKIR